MPDRWGVGAAALPWQLIGRSSARLFARCSLEIGHRLDVDQNRGPSVERIPGAGHGDHSRAEGGGGSRARRSPAGYPSH